MLKDLVEELISGNKTIITAPSGHGSSVLSLHIANILLEKNKNIVYYNSTGDIDSSYVKPAYPDVYEGVFFHKESLTYFINFLDYINYDVDVLITDPGDTLMSNRRFFPLLRTLFPKKTIIATSQIRQDPTKGGQVYSPIEELNKSYNNMLFDYSIWIRDVTEGEQIFKARYLDVFKNNRVGNKMIRRYLIRFDTKTGVLVE